MDYHLHRQLHIEHCLVVVVVVEDYSMLEMLKVLFVHVVDVIVRLADEFD